MNFFIFALQIQCCESGGECHNPIFDLVILIILFTEKKQNDEKNK
jgi:hypothetical protein